MLDNNDARRVPLNEDMDASNRNETSENETSVNNTVQNQNETIQATTNSTEQPDPEEVHNVSSTPISTTTPVEIETAQPESLSQPTNPEPSTETNQSSNPPSNPATTSSDPILQRITRLSRNRIRFSFATKCCLSTKPNT